MDEGAFVLNTSTFGMMDLEADMSSPDDLLYYLTDTGQDNLPEVPFDSAAHLLFDNFASVPTLSSSSSSPASSPHSSFSFSSSPSACSPVSSPSSCISPPSISNSSCGESSPEDPNIDLGDHFVFGSWIESALDSTDASTISPAQLQMGDVSLDLTPHIVGQSPSSAENASDDESTVGAKNTKSAATKKDTRKRKRTKKGGDEATPQTAVTLPRDELLKLSSQELEDYAENLRKVRKLTAEEEKDLRRQRRLIKNRESAQLSRVRRREHMEVLEQQLQEVQAENARLKLQVESLTAENLQLKQHVGIHSSSAFPQYRSPAVASPHSPLAYSPSSVDADEASPSLIKMVQGWTTLGKGATATAVKATYLFVILLSIGLFFNARFVHYGPGLGPMETGHRAAIMPTLFQFPPSSSDFEPAVPSSSLYRAGSNLDYGAPTRPHRDILSVDEMDSAPTTNKKVNVVVKETAERGSMGKDEQDEAFFFDEKIANAKPWRKETPSSPFLSSHSSTTMPAMATGEGANKTLLMCPTFTPLQWPGEELSADSDEITFLLPASSASYIPASRLRNDDVYSSSSSFSATGRQAGGSVVQLTCKIVDARMTSLSSLLVQ